MTDPTRWLCRDCLATDLAPVPEHCRVCHSTRIVAHAELDDMVIAHIDCDAFYASVEKRDNPDLHDRPVVIGRGHRGVVAAACYVARMYGIRSAMPMFKALEACPQAVVIPPDMNKYRAAGEAVRSLMQEVTPLVQPLSIDEAFLDLSPSMQGTDSSSAMLLAALVLRIEEKVGVTASIGLSYAKFLAKIASDLDKPRGFAVIGRSEARTFLADKPVSLLWGVGPAIAQRLRRAGITKIGQLQDLNVANNKIMDSYGVLGQRIIRLARGEDDRKVEPFQPTKSVSAETTFAEDLKDLEALEARLRPLVDRVADRLDRKNLAGRTVTLKLKQSDFRQLTRSRSLQAPTLRADDIFEIARTLLQPETDGRSYRLIGVGVSELEETAQAAPSDLFEISGMGADANLGMGPEVSPSMSSKTNLEADPGADLGDRR